MTTPRLPLAQACDLLRAALPSFNENTRNFADSLLRQYARNGSLSPRQEHFVHQLVEQANRPARAAVQVAADLSRIMQLFNTASAHLRRPAIVLGVPNTDLTLRLSVAGPSASVPGSLNVTNPDLIDERGRPTWYGRVLTDGTYRPSYAAPEAVADRLRAFAADPAGVAAEHGRLTGRCCFCNRGLEDERSTAVGYGPVCAGHYGLPWGHSVAAPVLAQAAVQPAAQAAVAAPAAPAAQPARPTPITATFGGIAGMNLDLTQAARED